MGRDPYNFNDDSYDWSLDDMDGADYAAMSEGVGDLSEHFRQFSFQRVNEVSIDEMIDVLEAVGVDTSNMSSDQIVDLYYDIPA